MLSFIKNILPETYFELNKFEKAALFRNMAPGYDGKALNERELNQLTEKLDKQILVMKKRYWTMILLEVAYISATLSGILETSTAALLFPVFAIVGTNSFIGSGFLFDLIKFQQSVKKELPAHRHIFIQSLREENSKIDEYVRNVEMQGRSLCCAELDGLILFSSENGAQHSRFFDGQLQRKETVCTGNHQK